MKRILCVIVAVVVLGLMADSSYAGGDKNRGDKGQGEVHQHQNN